MALLEVNWSPGRRELRQFALIWIVFFGLIGCYNMWIAESPVAALPYGLIALVGLPGVFVPRLLRPVYLVWTTLALPIGWLVSHSLLAITYYLVLTPIGCLMRLAGRDPLERSFDRQLVSYWQPRQQTKSTLRYFRQY